MAHHYGNAGVGKTKHHIAVCLICAGLTACGGGGGSSGGGGAPPAGGGNGNPNNNGGGNLTAADFETAEYGRQYGLRQLNASSAYAQGGTGAGVTIAVIDTGIDVDHPDLVGQISNHSTDIVGNPRNDFNDSDGHGTAVAGVIASRKNSTGTHGVAFDGQIMAIRADEIRQGPCDNDGCRFFSTDTIAGINHAVANGARVINLSISGPDAIGANYRAALNNAGNQGVVVVAAAGNASGINPENPAAFASDPQSVGNMLAVGAVDSANQITAFSNRAGTSASHFVVAAGDRVRTLGVDGGEVLATGTSFAAPHVAGAAAVLIDLFPALTAPQVVNLLRNTATDLGLLGDDAIYGKGLINLQAAIAPQGAAQVPQGATASGPTTGLSGSGAQFGAAFGDGPSQMAKFSGLDRVLFLDAYNRGYHADLSGLIGGYTGFAIEDFVRNNQQRNHALLDLSGYASQVGFSGTGLYAFETSDRPNVAYSKYFSDASLMGEESRPGISLSGSMSLGDQWGEVDFRLTDGNGMSVSGRSADMLDTIGARSLFSLSESLLDPIGNLSSGGLAAGVNWRLSDQWLFSFSQGKNESRASRQFDDREIKFARTGVTWAGAGQSKAISLELERLDEGLGLLGSSGAGVVSFADNAITTSITIAGHTDIYVPGLDRVTLFGRYSVAEVAISGTDHGLLRDWGQIKADSFSLGIMAQNIVRSDDELGLIIGQPLRVSGATAMLRVPKTKGLNGNILYDSQAIDLSSSGRELRVEMSYKTPLPRRHTPDGNAKISLFGLREPGHAAGAKADVGIVGQIVLPF